MLCFTFFICNIEGIHTSNAAETTTTLSVSGDELYDEAYKILDIVNKERKANGLSSLTMDKKTMDAAMVRSAEQSLYYSHTRPNGSSCFSILQEFGVTWMAVGENIAAGHSNAEAVMNGWMNSDGHRGNILSSNFKSIGIGVFKHNGVIYYTQMFTNKTSTTPSKPNNKNVSRNIFILNDKIKLSINKENINMYAGDEDSLYLINSNTGWPVVKANLDNYNIKYSSSNESVAKVSDAGKITAIGKGSCTIKATLTTGKSVGCEIAVLEKTTEELPKPDESPKPVIPPAKVANLHVNSRGTSNIYLDWNTVSDAHGYVVYRATSKNGTYKKIKTITSNKSYYNDNNSSDKLKSATTYYYKVRAYKTSNNKTYYGSYSSILTTTTSPAKVSNMHTDARGKTSIKIDWNTVSNASGYVVYRSTSKNGTYSKIATIKSNKTSYYNNAKLSKNKKYYYKVRAYKTLNGVNYYGAYSNVLSTYTTK